MLIATNASANYEVNEGSSDRHLNFENGQMYAVTGKSSNGKTTLLTFLSGITEGATNKIELNNKKMTKKSLTEYRRENCIVFQSYNPNNYLTPLQNVKIALEIVGRKGNNKKIAMSYLEQVGLNEFQMNQKCTELNSGVQQRVSIARALTCQSDVIFIDEPTANLDIETGESIVQLLLELAEAENKCVICVTQDDELEKYAHNVVAINNSSIL